MKKYLVNTFHQFKINQERFKDLQDGYRVEKYIDLYQGYEYIGTARLNIDLSDDITGSTSIINLHINKRNTEAVVFDYPIKSESKLFVRATHCQYGGYRYWFVCQKCHKKCRIVYQTHLGYIDRKCLGGIYPSQNLSKKQFHNKNNLQIYEREIFRKTFTFSSTKRYGKSKLYDRKHLFTSTEAETWESCGDEYDLNCSLL